MIEEKGNLIFYENQSGNISIDVKLVDETVWLSQSQLCSLFNKNKSTISRHVKNIFEEGELDEISTVAKYATVQKEGKREIEREIEFFNLDVIISVGYRVKSIEGTRFRQWASKRLKELLIQGYSINENRLKEKDEHLNQLKKSITELKK